MTEKVVINPVTRISGFLQITAYIEKNKIIDAKSQGMLFRGFEKMLKGRPPLDSIYFTERICGICSTAHSMASARALENAFNIQPDRNEEMIRDVLHGCEFLQNHLRHFYQYVLPDYVKNFNVNPIYSVTHNDFRIPEKESEKLRKNYFTSLIYSRKAHEALAVLGGKAPHNHGVFAGGVTVNITAQKIVQLKALITEIRDFIVNNMIEDVCVVSKYYKDYFQIGTGNENLMTYGVFDNYGKEVYYVSPGVIIGGKEEKLDTSKITENIYRSWYKAPQNTLNIPDNNWEQAPLKEEGYSWIKAPRYNENVMQVGPLARMYISGDYKDGISTMNRIVARALEAEKISNIIIQLLNRIVPKNSTNKAYTLSKNAVGYGFIDTTRGSLAHYTNIEEGQIKNYTIVTPSTWNLSPKDSNGVPGALEEALIGTHVENPNVPVEIGRIVRSFDPCVSCATHVLSNDFSAIDIRVV
ncbi:nickel-dependent hydrogenase large subunit [Clostridium sp. MB40-C1]|uniref:nickel-dependent hydrogenase large subunit n=1 Tax=Clostridium sp. MB40-C1 TaxID=3070996 RepID=UPI0027DF3A34|nr:nickel-dependent hydrogenase large subunit [Clostridium sp. MB40-C1]WMJ80204.1 nickel-dependent hydrogenase large subunit [Clostridium sp. MB40-C1]